MPLARRPRPPRRSRASGRRCRRAWVARRRRRRSRSPARPLRTSSHARSFFFGSCHTPAPCPVLGQTKGSSVMNIVILGGTGLIGKKLHARLAAQGHHVIPASPSSGVDILTGAGLAEVLKGADVVVDVVNSPSFEDSA